MRFHTQAAVLLMAVLLSGRWDASAQVEPPPLPKTISPVAYFRELLVMSPAERAVEMSKRPAQQRAALNSKIEQYASMTPEDRELRLRATELRFFLLPLMRATPEERAAEIEHVPANIRDLVQDRLVQWNLIPPSFQEQLLQNQTTLLLFSRLNPTSDATADDLVNSLSISQQEAVADELQHWQTLPPAQQAQLLKGFTHFFALTPQEKDRTLRTLSQEERRAMEVTLNKFDTLPPSQRAACVRGFQQFASMPSTERIQFLRNVDRWQAMSPDERQEWRTVVDRLSAMPPLPPGVDSVLAPQTPPLPIGFAPPVTAKTN